MCTLKHTGKFISLLLICMAARWVLAQEMVKEADPVTYRVLHWDVNTGLPHDQTTCMRMDTKGFLWVGTRNGLSRFDGNTFTNFYFDSRHKGSLPGPWIWGLVEDSLHNIWIGTDQGLSRYDYKADTFS